MRWARTSRVRTYCDPFEGCWVDIDRPITLQEVADCLQRGEEKGHAPFAWSSGGGASDLAKRQRHIEKTAWFVRQGFQQPLELDVGIPSMGCYVSWYVQDGNHRLAAAIFRQETMGEDPWLPLSVSGSINHAKQLGLW